MSNHQPVSRSCLLFIRLPHASTFIRASILPTNIYNITSYPWPSSKQLNNELTAKIIKFDNSFNGDALLIIQWQSINTDNEQQASSNYSEFHASANSASSSDRVSALNDTIKQFADHVVAHINKALNK